MFDAARVCQNRSKPGHADIPIMYYKSLNNIIQLSNNLMHFSIIKTPSLNVDMFQNIPNLTVSILNCISVIT